MRKSALVVLGCLAIVALMAAPVLAQDNDKKEAAAPPDPLSNALQYMGLAIGLGMGIAVVGGAMGQGKAIQAAVDAVARQPEAGGRIQTMMIIGLALIETLVIYMLLICFLFMPTAPAPA